MESIAFSSTWTGFGCPAPYTTIYTGEILFVQQWIIWERILMVFVPLLSYDIEQKNFRRVKLLSSRNGCLHILLKLDVLGFTRKARCSCGLTKTDV